jgi:hypothetical protein
MEGEPQEPQEPRVGGKKMDDLNVNKVIPVAKKQAVRLPSINHDFPVTSVVETQHKDGNGKAIFTIKLADKLGLLQTRYIDSQKDNYTVVDIPPGMIQEREAFFFFNSYFYST